MTKTNREFRSDLAREMRDKRKERNEQLRQIYKLPISESVKESAKKDIMETFYKQTEEFKSRPWYADAKKTHLDQIKAKIKFNKAKKEYEDAQIAHGWAMEDSKGLEAQSASWTEKGIKGFEAEEPSWKMEAYREQWKKLCCMFMADQVPEKIIQAAEKIPMKVKMDNEGSRLITIKLNGKTYSILDPELEKFSSKQEGLGKFFDDVRQRDRCEVYYADMKGDVDNWRNEWLKNYVKQKEKDWLHVPSEKEITGLLSELWKLAGLDRVHDQVAMLQYLTGLSWDYCLANYELKEGYHSLLECSSQVKKFVEPDTKNYLGHNKVLMFACA